MEADKSILWYCLSGDRALTLLGRRCCTLLVFLSLVPATEVVGHESRPDDLLVPAYTAMSFAGLCSMEPGWPASQPRGPLGAAVDYAQHIKDEIVSSRSSEEAAALLRSAATIARNEARHQLRENVIVADKVTENKRFRDWCDSYVRRYLDFLIRLHDEHSITSLGGVLDSMPVGEAR